MWNKLKCIDHIPVALGGCQAFRHAAIVLYRCVRIPIPVGAGRYVCLVYGYEPTVNNHVLRGVPGLLLRVPNSPFHLLFESIKSFVTIIK